jgi:hypothetical protein
VALRVLDLVEVEARQSAAPRCAARISGASKWLVQDEVDVHVPQHLVERGDVRRLDVDPREDRLDRLSSRSRSSRPKTLVCVSFGLKLTP